MRQKRIPEDDDAKAQVFLAEVRSGTKNPECLSRVAFLLANFDDRTVAKCLKQMLEWELSEEFRIDYADSHGCITGEVF